MQESETTSVETQPTDAEQTSNRSAMFIVFLVIFIDLLGFGIVLPLLPLWARQYAQPISGVSSEANPIAGVIVGLLMASFSFMQFLFSPIWGRISDRVGRRPVLMIGLAGSVVFYLLFGYALSLSPENNAVLALALLFVARIGAGASGATIATAQAVIADSTPKEKRKHGMALIGAAFGIGFTFGPLFGYGATQFFPNNNESIGFIAAGLSLIALILAFRMLPETRRFGSEPPTRKTWLNLSALQQALRTPSIAPVILTFFLATMGFGAFEVTLALLLRDSLDLPESRMFLVFVLVGFVLMFTQGFLYRRLAKRVSEVSFIAAGILFMAFGVAGLGAVSWMSNEGYPTAALYGPLFTALVAAVVGFAFLTPSAQALVSRRSEEHVQGEILGVNQSASALARILAPIFGVTLYKATETHLLPYVFGAALLLLMLPLIPRIRRG